MPHTIVVVDGMGGGIGAQLATRIRKDIKVDITLCAIGTNAVAAQRMADAGGCRGASGENAFRVSLPDVDFIVGPLGIVLPNAMMGEVTTAMAEAVLASRARKILLPLAQSHVSIVGLTECNLGELVDEALLTLVKALEAER